MVSEKQDCNWWVSEPAHADRHWHARGPLSTRLLPLSRDCCTCCRRLLCISLSVFHLSLGNERQLLWAQFLIPLHAPMPRSPVPCLPFSPQKGVD